MWAKASVLALLATNSAFSEPCDSVEEFKATLVIPMDEINTNGLDDGLSRRASVDRFAVFDRYVFFTECPCVFECGTGLL